MLTPSSQEPDMVIQRPTAQLHTLSFGQGPLTMLAERLGSNAQRHVLPGLGHVPIVTAPAEVAALIAGFGDSISVAA